MGKTENGFRYYTCKRCGAESREPMRSWKKKPQKDKNVCPWCIERRRVAAQERKERLADAQNRARYTWPLGWR